ncbi:hypothetical protein [Streptobacillus ratti]|uniref:hypothetical protein n=1 Tax=Streptobacillus ratti TaxID=1720557 RepID=UPI0009321E25|nr:hypothetical protein [Streptobacillus ratti]
MFRKNLVNNNPYENIYIYNKWSTKIKGLIKTPFFDNNDFENGYVVYYSEIKQGYFIVKFNLKNGEIIFEKKLQMVVMEQVLFIKIK